MVLCRDGTLYTGWATDVEARVKAHNAGRGSTYCKQRRPVRLVYQEELPSRGEAQARELAIKRLKRPKKLDLIGTWHAQSGDWASSSDDRG
jgi:putative endonuclease